MSWSSLKKDKRVKFEKPEQHPEPAFVQRNLAPLVRQKSSKSWFLNCPFHPDRKSPSLSVIVNRGYPQPVGFFKCFGCGERGYWNKLAEALNLETLDGYKLDLVEVNSLNFENVKEPKEPKGKKFSIKSLISWPEDRTWRGFSGRTIKKYGGMLDKFDSEYPLVFLCRHRNSKKIIGYIRCRARKGNGLSYIFSGNTWVSEFLWPENKLARTDKVVIVEGVRDALALICRGIPALAILGTSSGMGSRRMATLLGLGIETTALFLDGDKAGKIAVYGRKEADSNPGLKELLEEDFIVKTYKTWIRNPEKDPFKLAKDKKFINKFKSWLKL